MRRSLMMSIGIVFLLLLNVIVPSAQASDFSPSVDCYDGGQSLVPSYLVLIDQVNRDIAANDLEQERLRDSILIEEQRRDEAALRQKEASSRTIAAESISNLASLLRDITPDPRLKVGFLIAKYTADVAAAIWLAQEIAAQAEVNQRNRQIADYREALRVKSQERVDLVRKLDELNRRAYVCAISSLPQTSTSSSEQPLQSGPILAQEPPVSVDVAPVIVDVVSVPGVYRFPELYYDDYTGTYPSTHVFLFLNPDGDTITILRLEVVIPPSNLPPEAFEFAQGWSLDFPVGPPNSEFNAEIVGDSMTAGGVIVYLFTWTDASGTYTTEYNAYLIDASGNTSEAFRFIDVGEVINNPGDPAPCSPDLGPYCPGLPPAGMMAEPVSVEAVSQNVVQVPQTCTPEVGLECSLDTPVETIEQVVSEESVPSEEVVPGDDTLAPEPCDPETDLECSLDTPVEAIDQVVSEESVPSEEVVPGDDTLAPEPCDPEVSLECSLDTSVESVEQPLLQTDSVDAILPELPANE